jgi:hypothetical protein
MFLSKDVRFDDLPHITVPIIEVAVVKQMPPEDATMKAETSPIMANKDAKPATKEVVAEAIAHTNSQSAPKSTLVSSTQILPLRPSSTRAPKPRLVASRVLNAATSFQQNIATKRPKTQDDEAKTGKVQRQTVPGQNVAQKQRRPPFTPTPTQSVLQNSNSNGVQTNEVNRKLDIIYTNVPTGIQKSQSKETKLARSKLATRRLIVKGKRDRRPVSSQDNRHSAIVTAKPASTTVASVELKPGATTVGPITGGKAEMACPKGMFYYKRNQKCYPLTRRIKAFLERHRQQRKPAA